MMTVVVHQSGGDQIVSIPKAIGKILGLYAGKELKISIIDNKLVLDPMVENVDLEELLADSPRDSFRVLNEDREWLDATPAGREI